MHYQKCFLEVRIKELDLDCMYMYMVFWLEKEQQEPIYYQEWANLRKEREVALDDKTAIFKFALFAGHGKWKLILVQICAQNHLKINCYVKMLLCKYKEAFLSK